MVASKLSVGFAINATEASDSDFIEKLHIPMQQIARVISEGGVLTDDEYALLSNIIDIEKVKDNYNEGNADYIKNHIRGNGLGGSKFVEDNKAEFLKLYLDVGFRYPKVYLEAWVSQTRGFWNSGYSCWIMRFSNPTDFDLENTVLLPSFKKIMDNYFGKFSEIDGFKIFASTGVYFWMLVTSFYVAIKRRNESILFICLGSLLLLGTFLVATPLVADFRYSYFMFLVVPFVISILYSKESNEHKDIDVMGTDPAYAGNLSE